MVRQLELVPEPAPDPFLSFLSFLPFLPFLPFLYFLNVYSALQ